MLAWLGDAGVWAWDTGLILLVAINLVAGTVLVATRNRGLVNWWTSRWLAINLGLVGLAVGGPLVTGLLRLALNALPSFGAASAQLPK